VGPKPPLLVFLEEYPGLFAAEVLPRLDCGDRAVLAQVAHPFLAAVAAAAAAADSSLPRAGKSEGVPLKLVEFLGTAERLAWAKSNGCPWTEKTCAIAALGGQLEALRWARQHGCPWDAKTLCEFAAQGGHLELLMWVRELDCPWEKQTCQAAARGGHLEVLTWAREHGCPW